MPFLRVGRDSCNKPLTVSEFAHFWLFFTRIPADPPFRVIKRQFGYTKVRYRGLAKNTAHVLTLFALSNLWMKRKQLLPAMGSVRL